MRITSAVLTAVVLLALGITMAAMAADQPPEGLPADNPFEAPSFETTSLALERSGQLLIRVRATFGNLNASNSDDALDKLDGETQPQLAAHRDAINWTRRCSHASTNCTSNASTGCSMPNPCSCSGVSTTTW